MIGDRYNADSWNCTHEVAQWYELNGYGSVVKSVSRSEWDSSFVRWMRKRFELIASPEQGALVLMENKGVGGLHVGVWDQGMVHHCFNTSDGTGQTIRSPLSMVKFSHRNIRFWRFKKND